MVRHLVVLPKVSARRCVQTPITSLRQGSCWRPSFMDYAMPRADTLPNLATALSEVPAPTNRLCVRSGGEGGTTPALAAVINAIVDALAELGVRHIEMPATPERVWHAIRAAAAART